MNVAITLGPTREPIDAIRYITTASSGKMGYALAKEAIKRGHSVTIITGPVNISLPEKASVIAVQTASEMTQKTLETLKKGFDILISTAAIADYTPAETAKEKIKSGKTGLKIDLTPTKKLTAEARKKFPGLYIVAFKAEHKVSCEDLIWSARAKLIKERLNLVCANDVGVDVFGSDTTQVSIINAQGIIEKTDRETKERIAEKIWDVIEKEKNDLLRQPHPRRRPASALCNAYREDPRYRP